MTAAPRIADFRCRPVSLHPFYGAPGVTPERLARLEWMNARVGSTDAAHFMQLGGDDEFTGALVAAGISGGVVVGRRVPGITVDNATIAAWHARDGFIGVGAVSVDGTISEALREVEEVHRLGLAGVNLDPGMSSRRWRVDDAGLYPVYEACEALGLPVFLMSGPNTGPTMEHTNPDGFGAVARDFSDLRLLVGHGAWPFVDEMIGVAFLYENIFVCPDIYFNMAGASERYYRATINGPLRHQLVFATGFPFRSIQQTTEEFLAYDWGDALDDVCWKNGERLLGTDLDKAFGRRLIEPSGEAAP